MSAISFDLAIALAITLTAGAASPGSIAQTPDAGTNAGTNAGTGILLLAHGGNPTWNDNVRALAAAVDKTMPVEVAFGMATRANIQAALDRLVTRKVTRVVAVPLFVSSHSSIITSTEYLLGLRREMPPELVRFAKMSHRDGADHSGHSGTPAADGTLPVTLTVPISMTPALDAHPRVAAIVAARAAGISRSPETEAVILVAHGPVDEASNERWISNLRTVGESLRRAASYKSVDAVTVRDDAPAAIRDAAAAELRALVQRRAKEARVLIVPVLLSYGGIEEGIRTRLADLQYTMSPQAIAPDERLVEWVLEMAQGR